MKNLFILLLVPLSLLNAQQIAINEEEATVKFVFTDEELEGTISDFQFTGSVDLSDMEDSEISGSVLMETLDTDNWFRDRHLRSKKYFHKKEYPRLYFKSNSIRGQQNEFVVKGDLTIKGVSKPVTFTFTKAPGRLIGSAIINTMDFNITIYDGRERNVVNIYINLAFSEE
ncbi:YceI family protein [Aureitalea sp. L0-47]|uniref:YceI family protein n=1 Tax=Aureitalea sp. L0-47 TaxID=2816962 RepID=UPI0022373C65|nr:YceI family protein [Aureitalea sp. L0-47]MCW5519397.1 YceI family protein [Aureitalea sp. L0-47]